ncbi:MAG TPA: 4Fe-4S dicluster domain-containing protein [Spirochaetes bacterium]|nr:4Fe-4S dicluster domain-containing protein [Spirochaetota bacterium]
MDIYKKVHEQINGYSIGFPAAKSGLELAILKKLFTPEEAGIFTHLTRKLEPVRIIAARSGRDEKEVSALLEAMTRKGVTFPLTRRGEKYYAAAPFAHGFFEHNAILQKDSELMGMIEEYLSRDFLPRGRALRTVPVQVSPEERRSVQPFDDVMKIIEGKDRIGLFPCACATRMEILNSNCPKPREVCIAFDFYAEYPIEEFGIGRWIGRDEAMAVVVKAEEAGLVHQTGGDSRNVECVCNCCGDCCVSLRLIKRFPAPGKLAASNFIAVLDGELCTACGSCVERCPMGALSMEDGKAAHNADRCIGCGLCVGTCPSGALALRLKSEKELTGPPPPEHYNFMKSSLDYEDDVKSG